MAEDLAPLSVVNKIFWKLEAGPASGANRIEFSFHDGRRCWFSRHCGLGLVQLTVKHRRVRACGHSEDAGAWRFRYCPCRDCGYVEMLTYGRGDNGSWEPL